MITSKVLWVYSEQWWVVVRWVRARTGTYMYCTVRVPGYHSFFYYVYSSTVPVPDRYCTSRRKSLTGTGTGMYTVYMYTVRYRYVHGMYTVPVCIRYIYSTGTGTK